MISRIGSIAVLAFFISCRAQQVPNEKLQPLVALAQLHIRADTSPLEVGMLTIKIKKRDSIISTMATTERLLREEIERLKKKLVIAELNKQIDKVQTDLKSITKDR